MGPVRTRAIINAAGPWADRLDHSKTTLRPTKGVHLVIEHDRLPVADAVVMREGKRILFAIPWGERVILGTTDTDVEDVLAEPRCEAADRDYILGVVNRSFPGAALEAADVRSTWAGLRPLVANWRGNPSDISRNHKITQTEPGWWDVTGGKLTTYRLMAEQAVDPLAGGRPCRTAETPLVEGLPVEGISGVLPPPVTREAVVHYCRQEWARHLDDVMIRRAGWCHAVPDPDATAAQVLQWMAETLAWDAERVEAERIRYHEHRPRLEE
jgi:glycerol-3-phosphate dehydrogenase